MSSNLGIFTLHATMIISEKDQCICLQMQAQFNAGKSEVIFLFIFHLSNGRD